MGSEQCCKNCDHCTARHAGQNNTYYECAIDSCIVEPNDRACENFAVENKEH